MIVLSCSNISKSYIVDKILDDINFSINHDEKVGLVGLNGAGKSTLFNILIGELSQDSGNIYISKDCKLGYLEQQTGIETENTIFEEVLEVFKPLFDMENKLRSLEQEISIEGQNQDSKRLQTLMDEYSKVSEEFQDSNGYGFKSEIKGVLKGLGFSEEQFDTPLEKLSGGQKARVALAKILLEKPDILLLDEPTNHLDIEAIDWLEKYIREYKGAAIIISHDRYFLDNTVSKIFYLENSKLNIYTGNYTKFMKKRKDELELLEKKYEEQQKEISRQEDIIRRFISNGGEKFARQAKSRQKMLDKMNKIESSAISSKKSKLRFEPQIQSGRDVLSVVDIGKQFEDSELFKNISFNIYKGERVGLIGPNGIGKTTLFKIIMNSIEPSGGKSTLGHQVNIGYYDQEQSNLNSDKTIVDEIWDDHPYLDHYQIRTLLAQFLFIGDDIFKDISDLSGGEKSRVALLKLMLSKANFLLMDEPTNHLDIDSKEVLEDALLNYDGTLLVISHDRYFLNKVTDKILDLSQDGVTEYLGNYSYYLEKKNAPLLDDEDDTSSVTKTQIKADRRKEKDRDRAERQVRKNIKKLEENIANLEEEISSLEELMCSPEVYSDHEKSQEIHEKTLNLKTKLEELYLQWMELTEGENV
ncbi:ABC transporter, ATP-binding protein [Gottschalkia acidurici 9a]|uniref:ABC transporter, ATP-binding protein n=1 Tax=Gottschalkia acidurici (strain ATCC 7906 / DSM 604 / BCRC 14475 / CIP 104303 / KCTC 5404 / NCIMB 10678 / 9a) TaxID=1128398 RepID=K0AX61_GOTA9|nr:ABC-F family ATP-binding cassette domain-containing protein [Gottschalkia acidurici]AFS77357.1 ABC transporter, ATP-binding protein [Gottschalkia acidurici 9a]